jgi:hypothetical protein
VLRLALSCVLGSCFLLACATAKFEPVVRPLGYSADGSCTPWGGPPSDAGLHASAELARGLVTDSLATLGNEFPEKRRQFIPKEREPLQRFPRLTFPALVDPEPAGGARKTAAWLFPLILDKRQLGELPADAVTGELRFWLVPHGREVATARWQDVTECLVRASSPDTIFALDDDRHADTLPPGAIVPTFARRDRLRGVVFEIPVRTASPGNEVTPGFYDLRALPRMNSLREVTLRTPALEVIRNALVEGDWIGALRATRALDPGDLPSPAAAEDLRALARQVAPRSDWSWTRHPSPHFDLDLQALRDVLTGLARELEQGGSRGGLQLALSRLEQPMRSVLVGRQSVAPVALKDPERERGRCAGRDCVRVAVGGDFQYHGNLGAIRRFFGMLDPEFVDAGSGAADTGSAVSVPDVDFVLFAGDLADAAAGSAKGQLVLNALGALPPTSPYGPSGGNEMPEIRDQLARFQKPFFAVPGNHDGYAGYGGILNIVFDELGFLAEEGFRMFRAPRLGRSVGNAIKAPNNHIPTFIGWRLLNRHPRYDGLGQYQNFLGPLNLAFEFRGHSFVGLNSYDLKATERASVGGVVLYWGGGIQNESVAWMDDMLSRFAPEPKHQQLVFMHHDPRGAVPTKSSYAEQQFGLYDATDTPISQLTMGHLGLGNSPGTGLYIPVVSFLGTFMNRSLEIGLGADAGTFQQAWLRRRDWGWSALPKLRWPRFFDSEAYNAQGLIEVINCNLAGRSAPPLQLESRGAAGLCADPRGAVSDILFAHDNVPISRMWADPDERGAVFREPTSGQTWRSRRWAVSPYGQFWGLLGLKNRNGSPPEWAQHMRLDEDQGNARVLRMDDIGDSGNYHGFHIITLYSDGESETKWYALPR